MRKATFSSVAFIIVGSLLVFAAQLLSLQTVFPVIVSYLGFFSILAGSVILALTVLALMLPQVNRQLSLCRH
jgi:hypothetical protein